MLVLREDQFPQFLCCWIFWIRIYTDYNCISRLIQMTSTWQQSDTENIVVDVLIFAIQIWYPTWVSKENDDLKKIPKQNLGEGGSRVVYI